MTNKYDDIISLPRHISKTRPPMAIKDRAAQFSPFAALTGYDAAVKETARLTDNKVVLDEYMKEALNDRIQRIVCRLKEQPKITITYFQPDTKKDGGAYITATGMAKKINIYERVIVMADGTEISIDEIISIEGQIFETMCDR